METVDTLEEANRLEKQWSEKLDSWHNGYNTRECGGNQGKLSEEQKSKLRGEGNGMYGRAHTPEAKAKCREASLKRVWTPEQRQRVSESLRGERHPMYGKTHTPETLKKLSKKQKGEGNGMYGRTHTPEAKAQMSEKLRGKPSPMKGKPQSPEARKASIETGLGISQEAFVVLIAWLLREGWMQKQIARELQKSKNTIGKYAKHARHYNKTGEITTP